MSALREIRRGLWRWTVPHPEWRPGATPESAADWPAEVGSVLVETPDATVLIDALVPAEPQGEFLPELDRLVRRRELPVAVLTTLKFHRRSRDLLAGRYGASTSRARGLLPAGIEPFRVRGGGETIFWIAAHRTLVPGDRIIAAPGGGLRLCPESWLGYLPSGLDVAGLRELLLPLLELPIENVLVSHGDPVLGGGREALAGALAK